MDEIEVTAVDGAQALSRAGDATAVVASSPEHLGTKQTVLSALGACSAMTLQLYAKRKAWPLESVRIRLTVDRADPQSPHRIEQHVELTGDLDDEQRERLRQIAGRCPIHRMLEGPLEFEEFLVASEGVSPA